MNLEGKIAVVTGGSSGYGKGIAEVLREQGVKVWITGRNKTKLKEVAKELGVNYMSCDITKPLDWNNLVKNVIDNEKRIDILVNNAGGGIAIKPLVEQTDEEINESIQINLTGHIFGIMRIAKLMIEQKSGIIINISSICSEHAWPTWSVYSAAKAGIEQLAKSLHNEFREHNVHLTTITPSWGATSFSSACSLEVRSKEMEKKVMQIREMGDIVVKICSIPDHLVVPKLRIQPMIQEISPM